MNVDVNVTIQVSGGGGDLGKLSDLFATLGKSGLKVSLAQGAQPAPAEASQAMAAAPAAPAARAKRAARAPKGRAAKAAGSSAKAAGSSAKAAKAAPAAAPAPATATAPAAAPVQPARKPISRRGKKIARKAALATASPAEIADKYSAWSRMTYPGAIRKEWDRQLNAARAAYLGAAGNQAASGRSHKSWSISRFIRETSALGAGGAGVDAPMMADAGAGNQSKRRGKRK